MEKRRHDIQLQTYSQTLLLLTGPGLPIRPDLRGWVMNGADASQLLPSGRPLWAQTMIWQDWDATEEAVALGSHANMKDLDNRGWLWWATETKAPVNLILSHMPFLNASWWHPDKEGKTPFHHPSLHPAVAHAMACRWWADGLSWRQMQILGDPIETARLNKRWDLVSIWQGSTSLPWFSLP